MLGALPYRRARALRLRHPAAKLALEPAGAGYPRVGRMECPICPESGGKGGKVK